MIVYKFRSLGDELSLQRVVKILQSGEFRCSSLWDMNDPMEGIYTGHPVLMKEVLEPLFSMKNSRKICCFSAAGAFLKPTMWGYYANGFKGLAIEVNIPDSDLHPVTYLNQIANLRLESGQSLEESLRQVLTTKLDSWAIEDEYRYICSADENCDIKIGKISAVHIGWPYANITNLGDIERNAPLLKAYRSRLERAKEVASNAGIECFVSRINGNSVESVSFEVGYDR